MAFEVTERALLASERTDIRPNLVFEIDGLAERFGAVIIKKFTRIGDEGLEIGNPIPGESDVWVIGGFSSLENQSSYISFQGGTTTRIRQKVNLDRGVGEGISSIQVALIDKNEEVTNIISPGIQLTDVLGRKCKLYLGFQDTAFKDDYIIVFRGVIQSVEAEAGLISFDIIHPDSKKKSKLFIKRTTALSSGIGAADTTIPVDDASDFLTPVTGPNGTIDSALVFCIRIDDEIIKYTGTTGTSFTSATRGLLGTTAASHSSGANVDSYFQLSEHPIDLALKLMLGGKEGPFIENQAITNFVRISASETVANSIFFERINVKSEFSIVIGDFITTTGASNGANNVILKEIDNIVETADGSYITIDGVSFVEENETAAVIDFRSKFDTFPSGAGLAMDGDQVDVEEHETIKARFFASTADFDISIFDTVDNMKEFISEQLYNPISAYNIPRKSQSSIGHHIPPLPGAKLEELNQSTVLNASKLKIKRGTAKNFFNAVLYKIDESRLEEGKFLGGFTTIDATSLTQIPVGTKALTIEAKGLRGATGETAANSATGRRLAKYKFAAESISSVEVNLETGFALEIGDLVVLNLDDLKISNIKEGSRGGEPRLFEIENKELNVRTGRVTLTIIDTNFSLDVRYASISPCSEIKFGISTTQFVIQETFTSQFGKNEFKKWEDFVGAFVKIRTADFVTQDTSFISEIDGNTITVTTALAFTPTAGMFMEMGDYDSQTDAVKLRYGFMRDSAFADGKIQYQML